MDALPRPDSPRPDEAAAEVAAFLRARPRFLAEHPSLYLSLHPPRRVHGENLADHMEAMLFAERGAAREAAAGARAARDFGARAQRAVLSLIGADDPAEAIAQDWPPLLGLDSAHLAAEGAVEAHVRPLPAGLVRRLVPVGRDWVVRDHPAEAERVHGEAAALVARDVLLRLSDTRLLVLGTRDPALLPARGVAPHLLFLCRAAGRAFRDGGVAA